MFRLLPDRLPREIAVPTTLEGLGYFVTENDVIRQMSNPERKYQYRINRNERVNEIHKEAMNSKCLFSPVHKVSLIELGSLQS